MIIRCERQRCLCQRTSSIKYVQELGLPAKDDRRTSEIEMWTAKASRNRGTQPSYAFDRRSRDQRNNVWLSMDEQP